MCFHFVADSTPEQLEKFYKKHLPYDSNYRIFNHANGFDFPEMAVVTEEDIKMMQWGLVPFFVKKSDEAQKIQALTLNARAESIFEKPSFRGSIFKKRCITPATGWFEWMHEGKEKIPFHISSNDNAIISFGSIWSRAELEDTGEVIESFSIITTPANEMMSIIHNNKKRMPLIIPDEFIELWLDPALTKEEIAGLMQPLQDGKLQAHTISKLITSRSENSDCPEVKEPHEYPQLKGKDFMEGAVFRGVNSLF